MRIAVVLLNLGGPDGPDAVRPFLFNLFNDKAIINLPSPLRFLIATIISTTRAASAKQNYAKMGGSSPLLPETQKQSVALESALSGHENEYKCFIAMRYWKPFSVDAVKEVKAWNADKVVLLPLYPQFSTTTTGSSIAAWEKAGGGPASAICCYPTDEGLISAHVQTLMRTWKENGQPDNLRVLLSAHGLPKKIVDAGDPYQWQIEQTAQRIKAQLPDDWEVEVCYQSKVGPLEWIGPSTDESIRKAAADNKAILVSPIAFVSEHIETLVELDEEYALIASELGVSTYLRAPAIGVSPDFIRSLADLVHKASASDEEILSAESGRLCPRSGTECPNLCA